MRRVLAAGAAVAVVAGGGAALALDGGGEARAVEEARTATADVRRGDLVDTETVDGTLTYADEREVRSGASGTVTWVPEEGATVERGEPLLRVDGEAVTLMYGGTPMYRTVGEGDEGGDVRALERNLRALGYGDGLTVDEEFTGATADAVREWQDDRGLEETGRVGPGQVVLLPGAARIKKVSAPEGARTGAGQPVMAVTGTRRLVRVDLEADRQGLAREGARVSVELPGGRVAGGTVAEVGTVAVESGDQQNPKTTVKVDVTLDKGARTGRLDRAPVSVRLESERREGVLSVPIEALLALREGGFGVEVVDGAARRLVAVRVGVFGGGRVEVSGGGLKEGVKVGVPES
ncbi:peptidoglycan-binding protein [Spirillospora sp. NPDC050679]